MQPVTNFGTPSPASSFSEGDITGTSEILFQTFAPYPEKHQIITFHTPRTLTYGHFLNWMEIFVSGLTVCFPTSILPPHSKTHTGITFDAPARASSVAKGNENPDLGLECKAFPPNSSNILQSYGNFWNIRFFFPVPINNRRLFFALEPARLIPGRGAFGSSKIIRLLTVTLQYRNPVESSKLEATAAGSIAFIFASLHNALLKYPIYFSYPVRFSELYVNL
ncbi:hypothetical protein TNCV_3864121 [Trichonephila clavipes]|nr:hypothetical protein TNCV_3864121 [Trichonephila clavipes]